MNDAEDILTENESVGVLSDSGGDDYGRVEDVGNELADDMADPSIVGDGAEEIMGIETENEREEYERLIKTRFKELFADDVQRLINKRFKKYKALEEKVRRLEDEAQKYADIESLLAAERERAVRETEDRMNLRFKVMRSRVSENATSPRLAHAPLDVSKLTKSERAFLASRAQKGEKIHL